MIIFLDENLPPHLAKGFQELQKVESLKTGIPIEVKTIKEHFGKGCKDIDWISQVGEMKACVITQDININRRKHENELYHKHKVGMFYMRGKSKKAKMSVWEMVETLAKHWDELVHISVKDKKPFSYEFQRNKPRLNRI